MLGLFFDRAYLCIDMDRVNCMIYFCSEVLLLEIGMVYFLF